MHNEHQTSHNAQGFGKNTNGLGILIIAAVFTVISLFTWWLWNNNHKEFDHYRIEGTKTSQQHAGHGGSGSTLAPLGSLDTISGNYIYDLGADMEIILPDSAQTKMIVGRNSTEAKLFSFLSNDAMAVDTVDKTKGWITCDRIFFETGKNQLTESSIQQIERLATIIKAFPYADVKVGGYTDSTGSAEVNTRISDERATTVAKAIETLSRKALVAEGYGPLHPIADNATPEGRAMNRRVDIRVTKK